MTFYRIALLYRSPSRVSFHFCGKLVSTPLRPHSISRVISAFDIASTPSLQLQMQSRPSSRSSATTKPATSCTSTAASTSRPNRDDLSAHCSHLFQAAQSASFHSAQAITSLTTTMSLACVCLYLLGHRCKVSDRQAFVSLFDEKTKGDRRERARDFLEQRRLIASHDHAGRDIEAVDTTNEVVDGVVGLVPPVPAEVEHQLVWRRPR